MLTNYLKIACRNLVRNKIYTFTNVIGLALGIASAVLISALVEYHLSFDNFHSKADRIYRVVTEFHGEEIRVNPGVPSPMGEAFRNDHSSIVEKVACVAGFSNRVVSVQSANGNQKFEEDIAFADAEFFDIMDFNMARGVKQRALQEPNTAVITERVAKKYFGSQDPIGRTIRIDGTLEVTITGILNDLPVNTDRRQEIYLPFRNLQEHSPWLVEKDWWLSVNRIMQCFVLLKPAVSQSRLQSALSSISKKYYDKESATFFQFKALPISDVHFDPDLDGAVDRKNLWTLSLIGVFLIVAACVNFVNLATTQVLKRSVEMGIRKTLGGRRRQLFSQFITETALITVIAMAVGLALADLMLPYLNRLFDTRIEPHLFGSRYLPVLLPLLLLAMVVLSGSYPGLILAGFKPALALKKTIAHKQAFGLSARRGLVIVQFGISQMLIIATLVIAGQMRYSGQADVGFDKDAIVMLQVPDNARMTTLQSELTRLPGVTGISFCGDAPMSKVTPTTKMQFGSRTESEEFSIAFKAGDEHYVSTFGLDIVAGRNVQPSDTIREFLLNETAVRKLDAGTNQDVIGQTAIINGRKGTVVGVVKDFHNKSFHQAIDPLYISTLRENYNSCAVKINMAAMGPTLPSLEKVWTQIYPDHYYKYDFLDDRMARLYKQDRVVLQAIEAFAVIAIIIVSLGLYGMVSFMAAEKTKEVGVRKVLGANISSILWLFGHEFTRLLVVAFIITAPFAWLAMDRWLAGFAYRIAIGVGTFISAILISLAITLLTVGYMSLKTALMNPVKSLRSE